MSRADDLLLAYQDLDWDLFVDISDSIIKINDRDIDNELIKHASQFSYYSGLCDLAKKDVEQSSLRVTQFASETRKEYSIRCKAEGKKATAKDLDDYVFSHTTYIELSTILNESMHKLNLLKSLVQAFIHRKDMLIQLSANGRAEKNIYS
tara:strand:+ start:3564 stop:4013 length:450 start_codon:yes stop_codon:yes gene_type:complete